MIRRRKRDAAGELALCALVVVASLLAGPYYAWRKVARPS
jgi:hypothetical protein